MSERVGPTERHKYHHQGQLVYEWDQTLADISLYVQVPQGVKAKDLQVDIKADSVAFGLRGSPPFLSKPLAKRAKPSESFWTLDGTLLTIHLGKLQEGDPWPAVLAGHEVSPLSQQEEQKRLMLERFQTEHPGFDFSGATFNGEAPNPRSFMGGMKST